jgi:hypothetical protein
MNTQDFDEKIFKPTIDEMQRIMLTKGAEYSGDNDRLANFKRNAAALGLDPLQIWAVYAAKHWDAVMQFVKDTGAGKERERGEPIEGRVDDLLNCCGSERKRQARVSL